MSSLPQAVRLSSKLQLFIDDIYLSRTLTYVGHKKSDVGDPTTYATPRNAGDKELLENKLY